MTRAKIAAYRKRIRRAMSSLSTMGDCLLSLEIDAMSMHERMTLASALINSRKPIRYPYLMVRIMPAPKGVAYVR